MTETLIESFKSDYFTYRRTSDADTSFREAISTLPYTVINRVEELASSGDLSGIRDLLRQFRELRLSTQGSNDSVKERFEHEYGQASKREQTTLH